MVTEKTCDPLSQKNDKYLFKSSGSNKIETDVVPIESYLLISKFLIIGTYADNC